VEGFSIEEFQEGKYTKISKMLHIILETKKISLAKLSTILVNGGK
jgi:hypothetical protein